MEKDIIPEHGIDYIGLDTYGLQRKISLQNIKAVIKYLFEECEADLVNAEFMENNPASGKVMEKSGMKYEGRLRSRVIDKGNRRNDLLCYSITRDEYFNRNN